MKLKLRRGLAPLVGAGLVLMSAGLAFAATRIAAADGPVPNRTVALGDAAELESFLDEAIAFQLRVHDIPGATVSVVKDGALLLAKGYGFANLEQKRPVVASETVFRIGSVTKLFTWTAVMQLVEQGRIELDADVNTYLGSITIPDTFAEPITMAHLMTHTAGFEDRGLGLSVIDPAEHRMLAQFVATDMPARIEPPGMVTAYSNYGTALAGYIVERVSGVSIEEYVETHILDPLEMADTTLHQKVPPAMAQRLATSYVNYTGEQEALPREYFEVVPASGMSATATDMAKFMIAHLQDGRYRDTRILEADTAREMHSQQFANDPRLSGMTYGFAELLLSNQRLLTHRGTTNFEQFQSYLVLLPDHDVGLFVSFNGEGGGPARAELVQAFLDRYYPESAVQRSETSARSTDDPGRFVGTYESTRTNETTIEKFVGLIPSGVDVVDGRDGALSMTGGPLGSVPRTFIESEPLLFREMGGREEVAFAEDGQGNVTSLFVGSMPIVGFTKQAWWETPSVNLGILASTMLLFVSSVIVLPILSLRSRRNAGVPLQTGRTARVARGLAWLTSLSFALVPIVLIAGLSDIEHGVNSLARAALGLGLIASLLAAGLVVTTVLSWKDSGWGIRRRSYQIVLSVAAVSFVWFLNNWNLLGIRL
jgi:CubicO group peptidase (beta-lactamase class C family)